jgi:hypothetical protein
MRASAPLALGLVLGVLVSIAGCGGGGPYGYSRSYSVLGEESPYFDRATESSYEEVRRTRPEEQPFISWFGVVRGIEEAGGHTRLALSLRAHQERHLCEGPGDDSCRVTVSEREIGTFTAIVDLRAADREAGPTRLQIGSLVRVYGRATEETDTNGGPVLSTEWYRHWPPHYYVTTRASSTMRR